MASAISSSTIKVQGPGGKQCVPSVQQYHSDTDAYSTSDRLAATKRARKSAQDNSSLPAGNGFEGTLLYDPTPNAVLEAAQYAAEHWGFSARRLP